MPKTSRLIINILTSPIDSGVALTIVLVFASAIAAITPIAALQIAQPPQAPVALGMAFYTKTPPHLRQKVLGESTTATQIGIYFWGGSIDGVPQNQIMDQGLKLAKDSGIKVIRITLSPRSDIDYIDNKKCISNFTLAKLAARSDFKAIISDPQFTTVIITALDGVTFGDCVHKNYLVPTFLNPTKLASVETEYRGLATYLKQFDKTFIIANWEGDNDLYCDSAYYATPGSCIGITDRVTAFTKWTQARLAGIKAAGASNVFSAVEFNNVHSLENQGMTNILNNILPGLNPDYYSYSSYESINVSANQLADDIDTIKQKLAAIGKDPSRLFIGEFGFSVQDWGEKLATQKLGEIINVSREKNIPYAIVWNLIDNPNFGVYDTSGNLTAYGKTAVNADLNAQATVIAAVQGFNGATGEYTDNTGYDNEYLIIYGTFSPSDNTVYLNSIPFTPIYESQNQINIQLNNSVLTAQSGGTDVSVVVTDSQGNRTPEATMKLLPENHLQSAQGLFQLNEGSTENAVFDNQYLLLTGSFSASNNTVYINGIDFEPIFQNTNFIIIKMDPNKIKGTVEGLPTSVYVSNGKEPTQAIGLTVYTELPETNK